MEYSNFLTWIGGGFYERIENFLEEAEKLGASRRIAHFADGMVLGKSRVYIAHRCKAVLMDDIPELAKLKSWQRDWAFSWARKIQKGKAKYDDIPVKVDRQGNPWNIRGWVEAAMPFLNREEESRTIFGFFLLDELEFLADTSGHLPEKVQELIDKGIVKPILQTVWANEPKRGCGYRKVGLYMTAYKVVDPEKLEKQKIDFAKIEIRGPVIAFKEPISASLVIPDRKPTRGLTRLTDEESKLLTVHIMLGGLK
ncbi:MAG: hypothetical protein AB1861_30790 [Cyanobacteriota bacterium]